MRILLVKTTSLGDVIHCFPALTDALKAYPNLSVDWVVEQPFAEVVTWHPAVRRAIPVSVRQWRKNIFSSQTMAAVTSAVKQIRAEHYDYVIDAQGLIKSGLITRLAQGRRAGFDHPRESLAALFYQDKIAVDRAAHAVTRVRQLFARTLGYEYSSSIDYGLTKIPPKIENNTQSVLLLHGTTWPTKHWPDSYWRQLAERLTAQKIPIKCLWNNDAERARAETICKDLSGAQVMPKLNLNEVAALIQGMSAVVAVDTGLGHLSEALNVPTVSLYGPSDPKKTGTVGGQAIHFMAQLPCQPCLKATCAISGMKNELDPPCMKELTPQMVYDKLAHYLKGLE
jgi:heptosyltransferase-1